MKQKRLRAKPSNLIPLRTVSSRRRQPLISRSQTHHSRSFSISPTLPLQPTPPIAIPISTFLFPSPLSPYSPSKTATASASCSAPSTRSAAATDSAPHQYSTTARYQRSAGCRPRSPPGHGYYSCGILSCHTAPPAAESAVMSPAKSLQDWNANVAVEARPSGALGARVWVVVAVAAGCAFGNSGGGGVAGSEGCSVGELAVVAAKEEEDCSFSDRARETRSLWGEHSGRNTWLGSSCRLSYECLF